MGVRIARLQRNQALVIEGEGIVLTKSEHVDPRVGRSGPGSGCVRLSVMESVGVSHIGPKLTQQLFDRFDLFELPKSFPGITGRVENVGGVFVLTDAGE